MNDGDDDGSDDDGDDGKKGVFRKTRICLDICGIMM